MFRDKEVGRYVVKDAKGNQATLIVLDSEKYVEDRGGGEWCLCGRRFVTSSGKEVVWLEEKGKYRIDFVEFTSDDPNAI